MEAKTNYTMAGVFVIFFSAVITLGVIWLSSGLSTKKYTYYTVYMKESVSGLSEEGPVEFNGVKVGTVEEMKIHADNPQLVELRLKVQSDTPISQGTKAKLSTRALTGIAYILLEDKGLDRSPLRLQPHERYPVISTEPSLLVRLDTIVTQMKDSFEELSESIQSLLNEKNLAAIKQILQSSQETMSVLKTETIPATTEAINNLNHLSQGLFELSSEIKQDPSILIRGKPAQPRGPGE